MLWSFFLQLIAAIIGLFLADKFVDGVNFTGKLFILPSSESAAHAFFNTLFFVGAFLGTLNAIVKPILNKIAFPLRIITLNLFSLVIAIAMVWITKIIFPVLIINGIIPLFWTTLIVWILNLILSKWMPAKNITTN